MRLLHDEHHGTKACNDADSLSTSLNPVTRHLSCRTSRCPSAVPSVGYYRVFNLILWVLYTGMQWKGLARAQRDAHGQARHPLYDRLQSLCPMGG